MLILGIKKVDKWVEAQKELGNDVRWDGWTMVFFRPYPAAVYSVDENQKPNGVWRKDAGYGFETRVAPNAKGHWEIDFRNVKRPKHN